MSDWNPALYLKFAGERTRPAADLAAQIGLAAPRRILDVGCGPGNSTAVLAARYPGAQITGIDASPAMIKQAQAACPNCTFHTCVLPDDLETLGADWDVIFSNACLQWVPGQRMLIGALFELLNTSGVLAVQVPRQDKQPVHSMLSELATSTRWRDKIAQKRQFYNLSPEDYFSALANLTPDFRMWETIYYQSMENYAALLKWYRATGLRPYLAQLSAQNAQLFEDEVLEELPKVYCAGADGRILFPFPRLFFTAIKH